VDQNKPTSLKNGISNLKRNDLLNCISNYTNVATAKKDSDTSQRLAKMDDAKLLVIINSVVCALVLKYGYTTNDLGFKLFVIALWFLMLIAISGYESEIKKLEQRKW
jgi:hypothetical protein